jgi:hypothetical protein
MKKAITALMIFLFVVSAVCLFCFKNQTSSQTLYSKFDNVKIWNTRNEIVSNRYSSLNSTKQISVSRFDDSTIVVDFFYLKNGKKTLCFLVNNNGELFPTYLTKTGFFSGNNHKTGQLSFRSKKPVRFGNYKVFVFRPIYNKFGFLINGEVIGFNINLQNTKTKSFSGFNYWSMAVVE